MEIRRQRADWRFGPPNPFIIVIVTSACESHTVTEEKTSIELPDEIVGALNYRRKGNEPYGDIIRRLLEDTATQVELSEYVQMLDGHGVAFMTVRESDLAQGVLWILASASRDEWDDLVELVHDVQVVEIGDERFMTEIQRIGVDAGELHTHRRVPIRVPDGMPNLESVSIEEGIANVREFVTENQSPTQPGDATVQLSTLVDEFVDAGAPAVTIDEELWQISGELCLVTYLPGAVGYEVCGDYGAVNINGETYSVDFRFRQDGLRTHYETMVYVGDSWLGVEPVTVDEGLENARELIAATDTEQLENHRS